MTKKRMILRLFALGLVVLALCLVRQIPAAPQATLGVATPAVWQRHVLFSCGYGKGTGQLGMIIPGETTDVTPYGIYADDSGNVYIPDAANQEFKKFSPAGKLLWHVGVRSFNHAAIAPSGDAWILFSPLTMSGAIGYLSSDGEWQWIREARLISIEARKQGYPRLTPCPTEWVQVGAEVGAMFRQADGSNDPARQRFYWIDAKGSFRGELPGRYTPVGFMSPSVQTTVATDAGELLTLGFVDLHGRSLGAVSVGPRPHTEHRGVTRWTPWDPDSCLFDIYGRSYWLHQERLPRPFSLRPETSWSGWQVRFENVIEVYDPWGQPIASVRFPAFAGGSQPFFVNRFGNIYGFEWHADSVDIVRYVPPEVQQ